MRALFLLYCQEAHKKYYGTVREKILFFLLSYIEHIEILRLVEPVIKGKVRWGGLFSEEGGGEGWVN